MLVRNRYFHVYAALRTLLAGSVPGAPFPGLNPGDAAIGPAVGEVVSAPAASGLQAGGEPVLHYRGWREYAVVDAAACEPVDGDLPDLAAYLAQGTTAYAALNQVAPVRPGDTVFVSGGAGLVGSMAGPIARLLGAQRVIGSTGSAAKAGSMTGELGYDAVVVRGPAPLADQLAKAAPDGLDVVVDTVGAEDLQAAIATARPRARIALIGSLAGQLGPGNGTTSAVELDSFQLIVKQLTLKGYSGGHDPALVREWRQRFACGLRSGRDPGSRTPSSRASPGRRRRWMMWWRAAIRARSSLRFDFLTGRPGMRRFPCGLAMRGGRGRDHPSRSAVLRGERPAATAGPDRCRAAGVRPAGCAPVFVIRQLLELGLTVADVRLAADRLDLLDSDQLPRQGEACAGTAGIVQDRIAALDAQIVRLTQLRNQLAARIVPAQRAELAS